MTKEQRRESFRKWATLIVSTLALVVGCVRDPIVWTLRATIHEQLRTELSRYETILSADPRWEKHNDLGYELIKRLDHNLAFTQLAVAATHTNQVLLLEFGQRLSLLDTNSQACTRKYP